MDKITGIIPQTMSQAEAEAGISTDDRIVTAQRMAQAIAALESGGAVDSVNAKTGAVVLDPDDLDDSTTTNKFASPENVIAGLDAATIDPATVTNSDAVLFQDTTAGGAIRTDSPAGIFGAGAAAIFTTSGMGFGIDEDNMSSDSATKFPSQQSVKAYVDNNTISDIVDDTTPQLGGALDGQGNDLNNLGVVFLTEQAAAEADVAGKGQIWVKTATPCELWFTDDAGTDSQLDNQSGGGLSIVTPNIIIEQQTAVAVNAGNATSGSWLTAPQNTEVRDVDSNVTLSSDQITGLPAGDYYVRAKRCFYDCGLAQIRLYDGTSPLLYGDTVQADTANNATIYSELAGAITLSGGETIEIQYRVTTDRASVGLGQSSGWGDNVFSRLEIWGPY